MFDITEQRLMDQKAQNMGKKQFKKFELEEMHECESAEDQWFLEFDEVRKALFIKDLKSWKP